MKTLFDSNVIIDAISNRKSNEASKRLLLMAASTEIEGYLCAKQVTDIYYVLRKYVKDINVRKKFISFLLKAFIIIPDNKNDYLDALNINGPDYEDDILIYFASKNSLDYIIAENTKDFIHSSIKAITPYDLMKKSTLQ